MGTNIARFVVVALATGVSTLALSGCTGDPSGVAAFDREQEPEDRVSTDVLGESDVAPESTRLLAVVDGASYFAAKANESQNDCLVSSTSRGEWGVACASGLPLMSTTSDGTEVMFSGGGRLADANGWHFVADNLAIRDASRVE